MKHAVIVFTSSFALWSVACDRGSTPSGSVATDAGADGATPSGSADAVGNGIRVGFPIESATYWNTLKASGVLRSGDFVEFQIGSNWDYALGKQIATDVHGIRVAVHRHCATTHGTASNCTDSVTGLDATLTAHPIPSEIEYVLYDFEPDYEPEFTGNEHVALTHFAQADSIAEAHGAKVFATPFNPFRHTVPTGAVTPSPWNERDVIEAMPHTDAINVQLEGLMSSGVRAWCDAARTIGAQFAGSGKIVFVQVSFAYGTVADLIAAGNCAKQINGISGLYIWNASATPADYVSVIRAIR